MEACGESTDRRQIYALLYLSPEPLTADEISETLAVARSTVSTGLHELQTGLVKMCMCSATAVITLNP